MAVKKETASASAVSDKKKALDTAMQQIEITGLTGQLSWAATGEVTKVPTVYVIKDGAYAKVEIK